MTLDRNYSWDKPNRQNVKWSTTMEGGHERRFLPAEWNMTAVSNNHANLTIVEDRLSASRIIMATILPLISLFKSTVSQQVLLLRRERAVDINLMRFWWISSTRLYWSEKFNWCELRIYSIFASYPLLWSGHAIIHNSTNNADDEI